MSGGHTATAPVVSPDGRSLYVCNQFDNDVSVFDLASKREVRRIAVRREPGAADVTKEGKYLLVANQLPTGPADAAYVASVVSVIDLAQGKVVREIQLPDGGFALKDLRISPDGRNAAVTYILGRYYHPTTDVFQGWINANALTVIDIASLSIHGTVLLDEPDKGAANPWGVAWSADGTKLLVTHAGTHEVSVIDYPAMAAELPVLPHSASGSSPADVPRKTTREQAALSDYSLPFLTGARQRVKLAEGDLGPRAVVVAGTKAYVANYFSDTLGVIDLAATKLVAGTIPLGPKPVMDLARQGEFYFHDASICYQGWQSCSSCHPGDGRVDGLNWELVTDSGSNVRNTKSTLFAHEIAALTGHNLGSTNQARAGGTVEMSVRVAIKSLLFTDQSEKVAVAMDEYLKSLRPVPSPRLVRGGLSAAARRGQTIFSQANCVECHVPGLFTDGLAHDVGTGNSSDGVTPRFYTPSLIEAWRTAPYLHTGSAATIRDVLTTCNPQGKHGDAIDLSPHQLDDLCEYVLSL